MDKVFDKDGSEVLTKVCTKCGEEKPLVEFHKDKACRHGCHPVCKACKRVYQESRIYDYSKNSERDSLTLKACTCCGESRLLAEFSKDKYRRDGRISRCNECVNSSEKLIYDYEANYEGDILRTRGCTFCGELKLLGEFNKNKFSTKDGRSSMCRRCESSCRLKKDDYDYATNYEQDLLRRGECACCGKSKLLGEFYKDKASRGNGRSSRCKACEAFITYDYEANYERDILRTRECTRCGIEKPIFNFSRSKHCLGDGRQAVCKECSKIRSVLRRSLPGVRRSESSKKKLYNDRPENRMRRLRVQKAYSQTPSSRELTRLRSRKRGKTPRGRLASSMKNGLRSSLGCQKAGRHWEGLVGWTIDEALSHWESEGLLLPHPVTGEEMVLGKSAIDIHHIVPQQTFKYETAEDPEFKQCWAMTNLQPIWRDDHKKINHHDIINLIKVCKDNL